MTVLIHQIVREMTNVLLFWLSLAVMGQCSEAQVSRCSSDPTLRGYRSLVDVQRDMENELDDIKLRGEPDSAYIYTLCPNEMYYTSDVILTPVLSGAIFVCGRNGDPEDRCLLYGGNEQVRIIDSTVPEYPLESVSFVGITFTAFKEMSINAKSSRTTTVTFSDCRWTVSMNKRNSGIQ